jgi:hypothetical protein
MGAAGGWTPAVPARALYFPHPTPSRVILPSHLCQAVLVAQEKQAAAERTVADLRAELERKRAPSAGQGVAQVGGCRERETGGLCARRVWMVKA